MIAAPPSQISVNDLSATALTLRQRLVTTSANAKIPHLGSCLSCVELLVTLYWQELRIPSLSAQLSRSTRRSRRVGRC